MSSELAVSRFTRYLTLALALSASGCDDDDDPLDPGDPAEEIHTITLTVGGSTVVFDRSVGGPSGNGTLEVPEGTTTISAVFRRANGTTIDELSGDEFEVRLAPATGTAFTWTPNSTLGGSLVTDPGATAADIPSTFVLWHLEENHPDIGPYNFTVRIQ